MSHSIQKFNFNGVNVRVHIDKRGDEWWVLADVCDALNLTSPHKVADRLNASETGRSFIPTPSGTQEMTIINESGLYRTIFRSNKDEAKAFQDWVFGEVLPEIRRTGSYQPTNTQPNDVIGLAGITHQLTEFVAGMQARNEARFEHIENQLKSLEETTLPLQTELPDLETLRARFNGALREAGISSGMTAAEKTSFWMELNRALKQLNNGRARERWEVKHYENAVHYLSVVRDIDILWILEPVQSRGLEVIK